MGIGHYFLLLTIVSSLSWATNEQQYQRGDTIESQASVINVINKWDLVMINLGAQLQLIRQDTYRLNFDFELHSRKIAADRRDLFLPMQSLKKIRYYCIQELAKIDKPRHKRLDATRTCIVDRIIQLWESGYKPPHRYR